jgi:pimeloyl-ACP methyl ester carboxylesterase
MGIATRLLLVSLFSAIVPDIARAAPSVARVNWSPCYRDFGPYECGIVNVPLDYNNPTATISIAMVRLPALNPEARLGSIFVNPGGPGGSGVDIVVFAGPLLAPTPVLAAFDIVGFDPRGVGRSTTVRCFGNVRQALATSAPFPFPVTPEEEELWIETDLALVEACEQRAARIHDFMTTADVARDLDLLRQAVGDEQLNYIGYSYGSYLGVTYANLFPENVRALVVDGVLDPIAWATGIGDEAQTIPFSTRLRSAVGAQATLNQFFELCDAGACPLRPNSADRFAALANRLLTEPLVIPLPNGTTITFTYQLLITNALGAMYDSSTWLSFASFLRAIESLAQPAVVGAQLQAFWERSSFVTKRGFPNYPGFESGLRVFCVDSDNPTTFAAWHDAAVNDVAGGYFAPFWTWLSSVCATWGGPTPSRFAGPFTATTANPLLVIGNTFDPATPYHGAVAVANLLPNSALLTMNGWGHTTIALSQCVVGVTANYLLNLVTPPPGTVCPQDFVPFAPPPPGGSTVSSPAAALRRALARP